MSATLPSLASASGSELGLRFGLPIIGLVGGIGSGKSAVAAEFIRHGARVLSGDRLGHEALEDPDIRKKAVERWGSEILAAASTLPNPPIDRRRLGTRVFADPAERKALEALSFPYIKRRFREEMEAAAKDPSVRLVVLDAAVLFEADWNEMCSVIVFIDTPRPLRLQRIAAQRGWSAKEVEQRERAQLSLTEKVTRADTAIDNSGPPSQLVRPVADLVRSLEDQSSPGPARQIFQHTVTS